MSSDARRPIREDQIVDLAAGLLPEAEAQDLLNRIADDPDAEAALRHHTRLRERARIREVPVPRREVVSFWGRVSAFVKNPGWAPLAGTAAAVMLIVATLQTPAPDFGILPTSGDLLTFRSDEPNHAEQFARGLAAYERREWAAAIAAWSSAEAEGVAEMVRRAYLGNAQAHAGETAAALATLEPIADAPLPAPWGPQTRWTYALLLVASDRIPEARDQLTRLAAEESDWGPRAAARLETLPAP